LNIVPADKHQIERDFVALQWMAATILAGVAALVIKSFCG
jgi:hypothetical protein